MESPDAVQAKKNQQLIIGLASLIALVSITAIVVDNNKQYFLSDFNLQKNQPSFTPRITRVSSNNDIYPEQSIHLTVHVNNLKGKILAYSWRAKHGKIGGLGDKKTVQYTAPVRKDNDIITVEVSDGQNIGKDKLEIKIMNNGRD